VILSGSCFWIFVFTFVGFVHRVEFGLGAGGFGI
jgi:hypothetical protein